MVLERSETSSGCANSRGDFNIMGNYKPFKDMSNDVYVHTVVNAFYFSVHFISKWKLTYCHVVDSSLQKMLQLLLCVSLSVE